jgi:hypothetical protein
VRSILFQQSGVTEANIKGREGRGWVVYNTTQVAAEELARAVDPYYPTQVMDDQPASDSDGKGQQ